MKRIFRVGSFQPDPDRDLREEIQTHLELKVEELQAQGLSEEEAWREARRVFGNLEEVREVAKDMPPPGKGE